MPSHNRRVQYPNFCGAPTDYEPAISCLFWAVHKCFIRHECLLNNEKLSDEEKLCFNNWCRPKFTRESREQNDITTSIGWLKFLWERHHGSAVQFVDLVEKFDQIISNAMFNIREDELDKMMKKRDWVFQVVKDSAENILFSLITGVANITSVSGSLINNDERYSFLENEYFYTVITVDY